MFWTGHPQYPATECLQLVEWRQHDFLMPPYMRNIFSKSTTLVWGRNRFLVGNERHFWGVKVYLVFGFQYHKNASHFIILSAIAQAETLLQSLERAVGGISPQVNADKTEYMCFNQRGDIFTLNGSSLKLVNKFTYRRSSVSSTEKDINTRLGRAWTTIDRL